MTLNATLSSSCHSERRGLPVGRQESALTLLECGENRSGFPLARIADAIKAARRVPKAPPAHVGTPDHPAKASRPSYMPPVQVPCFHVVHKSRPFQKMRPIPSDSQSWSVGKHRALPPAFPASRKSSPARRETPAGNDRAPALSKSTRSLSQYRPPSNIVLPAANTPRHTLRPSQSPVATNPESPRNRSSAPAHSPAALDALLASGFLSSRDRSSKRLQTPPAFSPLALLLRRIRTPAKAKTVSPNPQPTFREEVRAWQWPAGNAPWFVRDFRPAVRAKESCPTAIGRADSAAAARRPSSRPAAPPRLGSGRNKFSPACSRRERSWDRAPEPSRFAPARCPNLLSPC